MDFAVGLKEDFSRLYLETSRELDERVRLALVAGWLEW